MHVPERVLSPAAAAGAFRSDAQRTPYITHLLSLGPETLLAVCDDPAVVLLDKSRLQPVASKALAPNEGITGTAHVASGAPTWTTSLRSGVVALWDARAAEVQQRLAGPSAAPYLSVASNGPLLAAGTELQGSDAYLDICLVFHPDVAHHGNILLSGGMDGLACVIDVSRSVEDDAVVSVGNTGSSLARVGWAAAPAGYHIGQRALADVDMDENDASLVRESRRSALGPAYTVSNMQTLGIWDADRFDALVPSVSAREPKSFRPPWVPDYVIDAAAYYPVPWDIPRTGLFLFTGDQEGGIALLAADADPATSQEAVDWTLLARLPSSSTSACAHSDIVRCIEWDDTRLYTGGEDGSVLLWNMDESAAAPPAPPPVSVPVPEAQATPRSSGQRYKGRGGSVKHRYTPYK